MAEEKGLFLVSNEIGDESGDFFRLYILVDKTDGVICDCCYQANASALSLALIEGLCSLILRKNYLQAKRISKDLLAKELNIKEETFLKLIGSTLNQLLELSDSVMDQCIDIPVKEVPNTPYPELQNASGVVEGFFEMSLKDKVALIEEVISQDIRPYIELDAGGIEILEIKRHVIVVQYSGSCTSCPSAIGSTLSYIQDVLQSKVHPTLLVEPDMSNFEMVE